MIYIRKATPTDAEAIATFLFLAMGDIVYKFIGEENAGKGREFMLHLVKKDNNQYSFQTCWVAEDDGEVVAAVNIYDGAQLRELRAPVLELIQSKYNREFNSEDETQAGEYYIDSLGVDPLQQGKGIGTKLLQALIDEYAIRLKQTLGLLVDEENQNAKRLYLRLGFRPVRKRVLFGKKMEHLQINVDHQ
jgi:ribosomal protein S18 acetylase RimI-like enzyme